MVQRGRLHGTDDIGVRVGKVVNKYKVGKHFTLDIHDDKLGFAIDPEKVAVEASLDGIYVVRTSLSEQRISDDDTVRSYKLLGQVAEYYRRCFREELRVFRREGEPCPVCSTPVVKIRVAQRGTHLCPACQVP